MCHIAGTGFVGAGDLPESDEDDEEAEAAEA